VVSNAVGIRVAGIQNRQITASALRSPEPLQAGAEPFLSLFADE
jgi:hypothetical protein